MHQATLTLDKDFIVGDVDPRLFGGFVEHLGRHIYTGIYEPEHPTADKLGFRQDVVEMVRKLQMPVMRYPGGNFVSGYRWEDGVGPVASRPSRLDLAWGALEPNTIGTNEFMDWCKQVDTVPMMAVNLGTRGPADAQSLVEYCNHPSGTYWSDLRGSHGYPTPHNIKLWCLGNEMDGPWQQGQKTAVEYGRIAKESAKLMKWTDPTIETILCGSSTKKMPTFGTWEWEALHEAYEQADYLSVHTYYDNLKKDTPSYLAKSDEMGEFIAGAVAVCDAVGTAKKTRKKIHLCFDEWNVWNQTDDQVESDPRWTVGRRQLEQVYNMEDALLIGGMLITLMNNADRVKIGCLAQVVNVIAPIMTEPNGRVWAQTIFHPFAAASQLGRGTTLQSVVKAPTYDCAEREGVSIVTVASVLGDGKVTVFAVNRDPSGQPVQLTCDLRGFENAVDAQHWFLSHPDLHAVNTADAPHTVSPILAPKSPVLEPSSFTAILPPYSWNVIHISL